MVLFRRAPKLKAPGFFIPNLRHRISPAAAPIATPSRLASEVKMPGVLLNGHQNGAGAATDEPRNVLGSALQLFSRSPLTGFYRDGFCRAGAADMGNHSVAGIVSEEFLDYTAAQGNDLRVVGLSEGCKWCLCAGRWQEALEAFRSGAISRNAVPKVDMASTHETALRSVRIQDLTEFASDRQS